MDEENNKIRMIEGQEGRWYKKVGDGKPTQAFPAEIEIWKAAKEEVYEEVFQEIGKPKEKWSLVGEIAKWATLIIACISFLVLSVDYIYSLSLYGNLGADDLSFIVFSSSPVHLVGVFQFIGITTGLVFETLAAAGIFYVFSKLKSKFPDRTKRLNFLTFFVFTVLYVLYVIHSVTSYGIRFSNFWFFLWSYPFSMALLNLWIDDTKGSSKKDEPKKNQEEIKPFSPKFFSLALPSLLIFCAIFLLYFFVPLISGYEASMDFLSGNVPYPGVCINTTSRLDLQEEVQQVSTAGMERYASCAKQITLASGYTAPSLQYLGQGNDSVYLYSFSNQSVVVIPKESVISYTLYHKPGSVPALLLK